MRNYNYSKDGITVTTILDTRRALANGEYPVKVRVTYRRQRTYFITGKSLSEADWERLTADPTSYAASIARKGVLLYGKA
jgi:hypothetical protein